MESVVVPYPGASLLITRTAIATIGLGAVHIAVDTLVGKKLAEKHGLNKAERIFISEKVCSTINAVFTAVIGFRSLYFFKPCPHHRHPVDAYALNPASKGGWVKVYLKDYDWLFPFYLGYTIYDMITMAKQEPKSHWSMWVHHVMGALGGFAMMFGRNLSIFPAYCMVTEATAIFNNLLWYYQTFVEKPALAATNSSESDSKPLPPLPSTTASSTLTKISTTTTILHGLRATSFILLRSWLAPAAILHAIRLEHKFLPPATTSSVLNSIQRFAWCSVSMVARCVTDTPWYVGVPGVVMTGMFAVLNGVWTEATVKAFLRRLKGEKDGKKRKRE
ncbi:hypothetical protein HDU97_003748 [Phlyctochytrium planicorne]|nr:hypothetical protein HDU97_003748 [Phlyctochytrium planicorne]